MADIDSAGVAEGVGVVVGAGDGVARDDGPAAGPEVVRGSGAGEPPPVAGEDGVCGLPEPPLLAAAPGVGGLAVVLTLRFVPCFWRIAAIVVVGGSEHASNPLDVE